MSTNERAVYFFERAVFQNIGKITEEQLAERLAKETQALCIVNTKKRAQQLYRKLKGKVYITYQPPCILNIDDAF